MDVQKNPHAGKLLAELEATKAAAQAAIVAVDEMLAAARQGKSPTYAEKHALVEACGAVQLRATLVYVSTL